MATDPVSAQSSVMPMSEYMLRLVAKVFLSSNTTCSECGVRLDALDRLSRMRRCLNCEPWGWGP